MDDWRDIRLDLPPYEKRVLVTRRNKERSWSDVIIATRNRTDAEGEHWRDDSSRDLNDSQEVIAWQPLPEKFIPEFK